MSTVDTAGRASCLEPRMELMKKGIKVPCAPHAFACVVDLGTEGKIARLACVSSAFQSWHLVDATAQTREFVLHRVGSQGSLRGQRLIGGVLML